MTSNNDGNVLRVKNFSLSDAAIKAVYFGAIAGAAGGLAEIGVVVSYYAAVGGDPAIVARGVTSAAGLGSPMPASPVALGIFIHMTIAVILGIALALAWKAMRPHLAADASPFAFMLAALAGVWAVNFFLVLPAVSPAFIHLLPYPVSLASKLLFGVAAAAVLHWSDAEMTNGRSRQSVDGPKKILAPAGIW